MRYILLLLVLCLPTSVNADGDADIRNCEYLSFITTHHPEQAEEWARWVIAEPLKMIPGLISRRSYTTLLAEGKAEPEAFELALEIHSQQLDIQEVTIGTLGAMVEQYGSATAYLQGQCATTTVSKTPISEFVMELYVLVTNRMAE